MMHRVVLIHLKGDRKGVSIACDTSILLDGQMNVMTGWKEACVCLNVFKIHLIHFYIFGGIVYYQDRYLMLQAVLGVCLVVTVHDIAGYVKTFLV